MKIEKVNDNQIRCTLTSDDLADRQLKLSELAYGTENAKALFRDMMQQAAYEFGFEAQDIPLMIEAVPMSSDSILLIITKVEYPEELDTRFSKFSDSEKEDDYSSYSSDSSSSILPEGADDVLDYFRKMKSDKKDSTEKDKESKFIPLNEAIAKKLDEPAKEPSVAVIVNLSKLFIFNNLDEVSRLSRVLNHFYDEDNTLYKNPVTNRFYLVVTKGAHTPEEFNKVCNILTEYSHQEKYTNAEEAYFNEHFQIILKNKALQLLATI